METLTYWIIGLMNYGLSLEQLLISLMLIFWLLGVLPVVMAFLLLSRTQEEGVDLPNR